MSFVVRKLPLAEQDAFEAAIWYEERQPGLGEEFLSEVDRAVRALSELALLHRIRFVDVRRAPIQRFKFYGVYYIIHEEEVRILAIFHGRPPPTLVARTAPTNRMSSWRVTNPKIRSSFSQDMKTNTPEACAPQSRLRPPHRMERKGRAT